MKAVPLACRNLRQRYAVPERTWGFTQVIAAHSLQDKKEDGEAEEEEEEEVERFADRSAEGPDVPETARKLHGFLSHVETDNIMEDYRHKVRRWRFNISGISFQNDSDARMSIFLAFVVTDERPAKPLMKSLHAACCGKAVPLDDLRAITRFTQAVRCVVLSLSYELAPWDLRRLITLRSLPLLERRILTVPCFCPPPHPDACLCRDVKPMQKVFFPITLAFRDWLSSSVTMTYAHILKRNLRIEVWEYHPWGAHVLLGDHSVSFSALVHSAAGWPAQRIARNVAPIKRGRSGNVGSVTFTAGERAMPDATAPRVHRL